MSTRPGVGAKNPWSAPVARKAPGMGTEENDVRGNPGREQVLLGLQQQPDNLMRVLGIVLVTFGAVLVRRG